MRTTRTLAAWDGTSDLMVGMHITRSVTASLLVAAGFLLAGCGSGESGTPAPAPQPAGPSPLASFDPCQALSPSELEPLGVEPEGEPVDQGIGEPGCRHRGDPFYVAVYKSEENGLDYWEGQRSNFGVFEPNQVGTRQGIRFVNTGSQGQGICNQVIEAGGGTVSVQVKYRADKIEGSDPCSKALEIAQQVEPKLPA